MKNVLYTPDLLSTFALPAAAASLLKNSNWQVGKTGFLTDLNFEVDRNGPTGCAG